VLIRIVKTPRLDKVDGIDLRRFVRGRIYDVGPRLAELFLSEGWAVPVPDDELSARYLEIACGAVAALACLA